MDGSHPAIARKRSLSEEVYDSMKADILACVLKPGVFVTESDLATRYGTSKTPIRFTLSLLAREGYIVSVPRRGTVVKPIEASEIRQAYALRMLLEPPAAELAARNASPDELRGLEELLEQISCGSPPIRGENTGKIDGEQLRQHRSFHVAIGAASGIERLGSMIGSVHEVVERSMNASPVLGEYFNFGTMDRELLDLIHAGDAAGAKAVSRESVERSREKLLRAMLDSSV